MNEPSPQPPDRLHSDFWRSRPGFISITFACLLVLAIIGCQREPSTPLKRVVVIGASASHGFAVLVDDRPTSLADMLDRAIRRPHDPVGLCADVYFFMNPQQIGHRLASEAQADDPTLIVGVDFLFWYAYGNVRNGDPLTARKAWLDRGLKLLDGFSCLVVVGDLPDMSPAVGLMLRQAQVPEPDHIVALNERLRDWAVQRRNVIVVPLARFVADVLAQREVRIGSHHYPVSSRLLMFDRLHPTAEGLVGLVQLVADGLIRHDDRITVSDFELDPDLLLRRPTVRGAH